MVGVVVFYFVYNWKIPCLGSLRDHVQLGATEILTLIAAVAVALYAYKTVHEMTKDRRKDRIEKMLEKVYNPFYEILSRQADKPVEATSTQPELYLYGTQDIRQLERIINCFSQYLKPVERAKIGQALAGRRVIEGTNLQIKSACFPRT